MIFIAAKFKVKPEYADEWPEHVRAFTEATRAEPGNLWFEWSQSVDDPREFVLVEGFTEEGAAQHVQSAHFKKATTEMAKALASTPKIISRQVEGSGWDEMGEVRVE